MIIRSESCLLRRDFRIHEAGHCAVGTVLRLPMVMPEVFRDGSGGVAPFDWEEIHKSASDDLNMEEVELDTKRKAATNIASMYLGGFAAEALASRTPWQDVIGAQSHDLIKAGEVLLMVDAPAEIYLPLAWSTAVLILGHTWPAVLKLAGMIPETDGTHQAPRFH